jgi:DNA-directed RNA polymerase subunit RPC12/RpoP
MKIAEIKCKKCKAEYETLESVPKDAISCPGCGGKEIEYTITDREFSGCGGGCKSCKDCK